MNCPFEEFLLKTFCFVFLLQAQCGSKERRKRRREVNAVLMLGV